jgi:dihydroneopterin aldolase
MFRIFVKGHRCHALHGVFPEERSIGQTFEVDAEACFPEQGPVLGLQQSISYTDLLDIIREVMQEPEDLLETVAGKMADRIRAAFGQVTEINITIVKLSAPIPNFGGRVGVTLQRKFD